MLIFFKTMITHAYKGYVYNEALFLKERAFCNRRLRSLIIERHV
ncbi:hypothetical protein B4144_3645 [Bacillus atrophaeus]|nr:hypothetical protein B4144_3645 [Bacillus atrophaeus]